MNVLQVQCPHCNAAGQIIVPPMGAIVFGPCPKCQEPLAIFLGRTFPLDSELLSTATIEERYEHLMEVLSTELGSRVWDMLSAIDAGTPEAQQALQDDGVDTVEHGPNDAAGVPRRNNAPPPITQSDIELFQAKELALLDNPEYFKSIFG